MKETKEECKNTENKDVNKENETCANEPSAETTAATADNMADESSCDSQSEEILAGQLKEWQDKYLRLSAEFDNYRKRTLKEKIDLLDNASEGVIKAILPIVDDFDRATAAMEKSDDINSLKSGVELIHKRLIDVLKQQGVAEIVAKDADLDTDYHDAIAKFPVEDDSKKGKVIDVIEKGYMMKEKVIRFAKVVVGQ